MELNEIINAVKKSKSGSIKHYYLPERLTKEQRNTFKRNGIKVTCRKRANAWFEIDMVNA